MPYQVKFKSADEARITRRALVNHYRHTLGSQADLTGITLSHTTLTVKDSFKDGLEKVIKKGVGMKGSHRYNLERVSE